MTNNPTIDGVSLALGLSTEAASVLTGMIEYCLNARVCMGMDEGFKSFEPEEEHEFVKELRALLDADSPASDAPAVERQEAVPVAWMRFDEDQKAIFTRSKRNNSSEPLYAHPTAYRNTPSPELAALQSRIDQLEAEAMYAAATYQDARARIEELESGSGEPVAWMLDGSVGGSSLEFQITDLLEIQNRHGGCLVPLFVAQPAPVAVVPDGWKLVPVEPTELMIRRGDQNYSWSVAKIFKAMIEDAPACLDATAALNRRDTPTFELADADGYA